MRRMIPLAWWIPAHDRVLRMWNLMRKNNSTVRHPARRVRYGACCSQACHGYPMPLALVLVTLQYFQVGQNYNKMYWTEPQYNEPQFNKILVITNTIQKCKHKIYLDITSKCQYLTERCNYRWIRNRPTRVKFMCTVVLHVSCFASLFLCF